jgi:hypothetical protein
VAQCGAPQLALAGIALLERHPQPCIPKGSAAHRSGDKALRGSVRMTPCALALLPRIVAEASEDVGQTDKRNVTAESVAARPRVLVSPVRQSLGDNLGRLHRRLAQVRVFGDLALNPRAFTLQHFAQGMQL